LPTRNSGRVTGVERKLAMVPVSFSRTTLIADMIAGISIRISIIIAGTMALALLNAWLNR
jgi:hypothetical protein